MDDVVRVPLLNSVLAEVKVDEVPEVKLPLLDVDDIIVDELLKKFEVAELKVDEVAEVKLPLLDVGDIIVVI